MKMCVSHWDQLRAALRAEKLSYLISDGRIDEAAKTIEAGIETINPLVNSYSAILANALKTGGYYLLMGDETGKPYCPLCELNKHYSKEASKQWVKEAAKEQRIIAEKTGLISDN